MPAGASFPTHIKLNTHVEYIILSRAECEPLISVDKILLRTKTVCLADMLEEVRKALGAKAIVALRKNIQVIEVVKAALDSYPHLKVMPLGILPCGMSCFVM